MIKLKWLIKNKQPELLEDNIFHKTHTTFYK